MEDFIKVLIVIINGILKIIRSVYMLLKRIVKLINQTAYRKLYDQGVVNNREKKIFIFGLPHAGKSTALAAFVKFMTECKEFTFRRDPVTNKYGVKIIRKWVQDYKKGTFPLQTPKDEYTRINIEYEYPGALKPNKLIVYEIAGEDVIKFDPTHDDHHTIPPELSNFLLGAKAIIIFASSIPERSDEPEVVQDFIEYILRKKITKPICFILTKYDLIENQYQSPVQASKAIYKGATDLLFRYENSTVQFFSVGEVKDNEIVNDKSHSCSLELFNWIKST